MREDKKKQAYLVYKPRAISNTRVRQARGRWSRPSDLMPNITGEGVTEDLQFEVLIDNGAYTDLSQTIRTNE